MTTSSSLQFLVLEAVIKIALILFIVLTAIAYLTWLERKVIAHIQSRWGPYLVGPSGLLQPLADGLKLAFKEDFVPAEADRLLYTLAPVITFVVALLAFAVIPFGTSVTIHGLHQPVEFHIADLNIGVLYLLAISSLGVYGIVFAGWSSNSKYSLLGGLRSGSQMLSYEIPLGLSVVSVLIWAGSLRLHDIVEAQARVPFIVYQPIGFVLFVICGLAEINRAPFDLPEAESELIAGFHTEYASMKFAMFFMAEYVNMLTVSALATTLFLGGWRGPVLPVLPWLWPTVWFSLKVAGFVLLFIWIRATWHRFRYDKLMSFGWKVLLPVGLLNVMLAAGLRLVLAR
jgi:NADH-quinone oxidoreductase subunit H